MPQKLRFRDLADGEQFRFAAGLEYGWGENLCTKVDGIGYTWFGKRWNPDTRTMQETTWRDNVLLVDIPVTRVAESDS